MAYVPKTMQDLQFEDALKRLEEQKKRDRMAMGLKYYANSLPATAGYVAGGLLGDALNRWLNPAWRRNKQQQNETGDQTNGVSAEEFVKTDPQMANIRAKDLANYQAGGTPFVGLLGDFGALENKTAQTEMNNGQGFSVDNWNLQNAINAQYPSREDEFLPFKFNYTR